MTVDKVEHLLKLADEYQTKSVFNVCVNLLKNEVAGSEEKAMSILYLANTTDMARKDEKLDVVRNATTTSKTWHSKKLWRRRILKT